MLKLLKQTKIQILIILLLTFFAYSNIFQNEFTGDDYDNIVNWKIPKSFSNLPFVLVNNDKDYQGNYRPIRTIFIMINYQLWGLNPYGYHFFSMIVILLNPVLIYLIAEQLIKKRTFAFLAGLLFGLHPIHTELHTAILGSIEVVGMTFFLGAFYFYLKARTAVPRFSIDFYASLSLASFAFFHNETTLSLLLIIVFYDLCFKYLNLKKINFNSSLKIYAPYFVIALVYMFIRFFLLHIGGRGGYLENSFYLTMLTMTKGIVQYIETLILPVNLTINPIIYPGIQSILNPYSINLNRDKILAQSIFDFHILVSLGILISLIILAAKSYKAHPIITFSIGWFFITLIPVSNIIPIGNIIQLRYVYLGSVGYALLLSYLLSYLLTRKYNKSLKQPITFAIIFFLIILLSFYGYRTYLRNKDYKSPITMWTKLSLQLPNDIPTLLYLGFLYEDKGQDEKALKIYQQVAGINSNIAEVYLRQAKIYQRQGYIPEAILNYSLSLFLNPNSTQARVLLKTLLKDQQQGPLLSTKRDGFVWQGYLSNNEFLIFYPADWEFTDSFGSFNIQDPDQKFNILISTSSMLKSQSTDSYLKSQLDTYGELVNQGLAQIPNFDLSYVKIWNENGIKKLQFFLFKDTRVIKVLVFPGDSPQMRIFDDLLRSIII